MAPWPPALLQQGFAGGFAGGLAGGLAMGIDWRLECLDGKGPCELRPERGSQRLRVGRAVQAGEFWEWLLPDEGTRNSVSREHFELREVPDGRFGTKVELCNRSARGTVLNGVQVHDVMALTAGDVLAVGLLVSEYGSRPALHFRFVLEGSEGRTSSASESSSSRPPLPSERCRGCNLEWAASAGLRPADIAAHPLCLPFKLTSGPVRLLRVGRAIQPPATWEILVPDPALRTAVSREHFEVRLETDDATGLGTATLQNFSSCGTLLNGALVRDRSPLEVGQLLGVPRPREAGEGDPIVQFRLAWAAPEPLSGPVLGLPDLPQRSRSISAECPAQSPRLTPALKGLQRRQAGSAAGSAAGSLVATPAETPSQSPRGPRDAASAAPRIVVDASLFVPPVIKVATEAPSQASLSASGGGPGGVVKVSMALPPPFYLECTHSQVVSPEAVAALPREQRALEASCSNLCLKVGRSVQPPEFWARLLPEEALRNSVSREHFAITLEEEGLLLANFSALGTRVNSKCISDKVRVLHGDRIGIGSSPGEKLPVLWFSLHDCLQESEP